MSKSKSSVATFAKFLVVICGVAIFVTLMRHGTPVAADQRLPELAVAGWLNERPPDLTGKIVVLDVWGTFCQPCLDQMPDMVRLHEAFGDSGVVILGLTPEGPLYMPEIRSVLDMFPGMTWPIGYGAGPTLEALGWDNQLPTYIVFDRRGKSVWSSHSHTGLEDQLIRLVAE